MDQKFSAVLIFDFQKAIAGGCKVAYFGKMNKPIFNNAGSQRVCVKKVFFLDGKTGKQCMHDHSTQIKNLTTEITYTCWTSALMDLIYTFMKTTDLKQGTKPIFLIPQMYFINLALVIIADKAYLLEEMVEEEIDGNFCKYITMGVPKFG